MSRDGGFLSQGWKCRSTFIWACRGLLWKYIVFVRFSRFFFFWTHEWLRTLVYCMNTTCWEIRKPSDWSVHNPSRKAIASFPRWGFMSFVSGLKSESCSVMSDSLPPHGLYSPWNSPGQDTGVGSLSLLWGIFPTQRLNPGLLHCGRIFYQLSHKGSPRILQWVAYPFSRGSSQPRNSAGVSCIAGRFFTNLAMREVRNLRDNFS